MAIYHFSGSVISRSKGKCAVASAAYRSGEKLHDERQEKTFDYGRKQDIAHKEIMLPEGAPEWMKDREKLWNAVEAAENRKDSQLAREFNFALPREFTKEQNIELAREFVQNEFVAKGMIADLCIHDGKGKDGEEQPHAHVMLTMREVTEEGFGLKERSWNAKENLLQWREAWAECANKYLALNDIDQRIDHKTLEGQGIDLEPQKKIGPDILRAYEARVEEHRQIAKENGEKILEDPSIALKAITYHQSTFTHQDLARFINRHTIDAEQFQMVYEKVKVSEQIVTLVDEQGKERFTTKEMQALETKMLSDAIELKDKAHITTKDVYNDPTNAYLSSQQQDALNHIIGDGDIKCLVGYAGTGKSRLLGEAKEIWEKEGYRVHGATLAGIAAENLEAASGISSRTLASRCYYWDRGAEQLTNKDVLVIDEAGMLGSRQVARVLNEVKEAGAKAVLIGDPQQLQAIEAGAAFRAILEQMGYFELTEIRRQQEPWQQEATKEFALQNTQEALNLYEQHDCLHLFATRDIAKSTLVEKWNDVRIDSPDKSQIMLSYTRRDAQELNEMARAGRKENNELGEDQELRTADGNKDFAINDRIYFLRNDRSLGVKNGTLGIIENIDKERGQVVVKLDREDLNGNSQVVTFNLDQYNHITHGYAATIHKAQSITVDRSYILASKHLDSHAIYVGMSRHKESAELFWSKEEFADKAELEQILSRDRSKDITLDYTGREKGYEEGFEDNQEKANSFMQESSVSEYNEKTVAELVEELAVLGKNHEESSVQKHVRELKELSQKSELQKQTYYQEIKEDLNRDGNVNDLNAVSGEEKVVDEVAELKAFQEKFESEHPDLAAKAHEEMEGYRVLQESREKVFGRETGDYKALLEGMKYNGLDRDTLVLKTFEKEFERVHPKDAEITKGEIEPHMLEQRYTERLIDRYHELEEKNHDVQERHGNDFSETETKDQMEKCAYDICHNQHAMDYLQKNDRELFNEMNALKERELVLEMQKEFDLSL